MNNEKENKSRSTLSLTNDFGLENRESDRRLFKEVEEWLKNHFTYYSNPKEK